MSQAGAVGFGSSSLTGDALRLHEGPGIRHMVVIDTERVVKTEAIFSQFPEQDNRVWVLVTEIRVSLPE